MSDTTVADPNTLYDKADTTFVAIAAMLVFLMVPGIGLLYSGLSRRKHALSLLWCSLCVLGLCAIQWYFLGYSLAFSHNTKGSGFIGSLQMGAGHNMLFWGEPSVVTTVPDVLFAMFQLMFACVTTIILCGGSCERARLFPLMVFMFIWLTVVYCPIACWYWNPTGWLATLGVLDYAGGGPVHMSSGAGALAYALCLGKRNDPLTQKGMPKYKPHSVTSVVLGTVFIWFAWFGFNPGSAGAATIRAWYSFYNTNLCAATCSITWLFIDYVRFRKWTTVGLCSGAISGLVVITPAAGFVPLQYSFVMGVIGAFVCNFGMDLKNLLRIDDGLDVFSMHGLGGLSGAVMTGLFTHKDINALSGVDAAPIAGGWLNHHYVQLGYQIAGACATMAWSFVITVILLTAMNYIPFLKIRLSEEEEELGVDATEIGEFTYEEGAMYIPEPVRSKRSVQQPEPMSAIDDNIVSDSSHSDIVHNNNEKPVVA